ncbi:flagellar hook-associated protein FlgK [Flexibacterium corallicola]|uniref:flagellar hook-associated protein FlgK n=1 Tax=Flexibacterium corallicola TaxID=3037259 RepID=UPI00286F0DA5|nr:flagellar hook-associated protein FlgK [Pseudovibrio sp. M1P-2-3]
MSLTAAMITARSSLATRSAEIAVTSENVANVNNRNYSRQTAVVSSTTTASGSTVYVSDVTRATNQAATTEVMRSGSVAVASGSYATLLDSIGSIEGSPLYGGIATSLGQLESDLQAYANDPANQVMGQKVLETAYASVNEINTASQNIQDARAEADASMANAVTNINDILERFDSLNREIISGTASGENVNAQLDEREQLIRELSEEIGIDVQYRDNNDAVIYTDSGVTLYETSPREVTFTAQPFYAASTVGNAIYVDGISVAGPGALKPVEGGAIAGYAKMRDDTGVTLQEQLDELAFALIDAFKEVDQTSSGLPDQAGLFTDGPNAAIPTSTVGLAATLSVNTAAASNVETIRDGGMNIGGTAGDAYVVNRDSVDGYTDHLNGLVRALSEPDLTATGFNTDISIVDFATNSASWYSAERSRATEAAILNSSAYNVSLDTLSNSTGVNIDLEMSRLLDIENAYSASAQLMTTVDSMFKELLSVVR